MGFLLLLTSSLCVLSPSQETSEPPARSLSRALCETTRLAGTPASLHAVRLVANELSAAGFEVELDRREVLLSFPRKLVITARTRDRVVLDRAVTFDARDPHAGDVPKYNAWSASADVEGPLVDVGRGLRADYEGLAERGVDLAGAIALARYGGSYRGVKAELAEHYGCSGLLLFTPAEADGAGRGPVYPEGPWKPGWEAQRGSISPLASAPGDPSTPGWPSPPPADGRAVEERAARRDPEATAAALPRIPCLPLGADDAAHLLAATGEVRVRLALDVPRELHTIVNVIGRLPGRGPDLVLAGNHRDAWVRGAQDAGSGTVSLLLAARALGQRAREGWRPLHGLVLGFWDAEEFGLIGSTEWAEAHAEELRAHGLVYVNADAAVSGPRFGASGTPGLLAPLRRALERVPAVPDLPGDPPPADLWADWSHGGARTPRLELPGSGSDYTVFLHHLGMPILDLGMGGGSGSGQYHTSFDDFDVVDRFLDPDWEAHGAMARALTELLGSLCDAEGAGFDPVEAARAMAAMVRAAGAEDAPRAWLGQRRAERLARAFDALASVPGETLAARPTAFYARLADPEGLVGRAWFRNRLWAPGLETGYAAETLPGLRAAAREGDAALEHALDQLVEAVQALGTTPPDGAGRGGA